MRFARIITALVSFALLGLLPLASADAAKAGSSHSVAAAKSPTSARAAERTVGIKIVKKKGKLILLGNVKPPKGPVTVQKATKCNVKKNTCNFKFYKTVPVKKGRYQVRVFAPKNGSWAWRARVGTTTSDIWVTCTRSNPGAACPTP